ncbi:hypothetical protein BS47DRAFT_1435234 [Hydnum rufescens UP504]|uniref:Uncharacterized protein n=1 Tax=Hydnum rufescens UP504 TaxID=1448309 RepID=A0A9P6B4R5_9AGAM|nr:hypothetical protein BS47DRAFT_1435234 [Hydnum rufescens UP504]
MTHIFRSAKSGINWASQELEAYNITVQHQAAQKFFGSEPTQLPQIDPKFVTGTVDSKRLSDTSFRLLLYLSLASCANTGQKSALHDFSCEILRLVGFEERGTLLRSHYGIPLVIGGETRLARTNICLIHPIIPILLVLQEDTFRFGSRDPEAQVIAGAIAAFQFNNRAHLHPRLNDFDSMTIPCITMRGTHPVFYKVPVTKALSSAVMHAAYPHKTTIVTKCRVPPLSEWSCEGMEVPAFRRVALQYYQAFKGMVKGLWQQYLV